MKVFKFGGASVKDAEGVRNVASVIQKKGDDNTLVVISAMGKTTNAMENVIKMYFEDKQNLKTAVEFVLDFHLNIISDLFESETHPVKRQVLRLFNELTGFMDWNKSPDYNYVYDQIIGYGELVSTTIVSAYLNEVGVQNTLKDAREVIKTDNYYRTGNVNWALTQELISMQFSNTGLVITQGFLGSDSNNFTTTLGREGSDYTAAIFAFCLNADSVTIWKDVPGVLNADPRAFNDTQLLNTISYREAIELAFYGASVIHPKTLQPLQKKEIPLHVKSFLNPDAKGTKVTKGIGIEPAIPCFIVKKNQVMIALSSLDFSYIVEENISEIFNLLHLHKMKVDVIQNSAISFSVCFDNKYNKLDELLVKLKAKFRVNCYENVSLYTVRHYNDEAVKQIESNKDIVLKQLTQETIQLVAR